MSNKVHCGFFVVHCIILRILKDNDVFLLCTVMPERNRYAMFNFHSMDIVVGFKVVF